MKKQDPYICCLQETQSVLKTHIDWKWEDGKNIFQANGEQKKAAVAILIPDKIDLKIKKNYKR